MKGVILAGGLGTRLYPLTKITNKHLLPVYNKPMIYYPLQRLAEAGIKDVLIVTGGNHAGEFLRLLGNGKDLGFKEIHYAYQVGEKGIADALRLAQDFADGEKIVVILGDNVFGSSLKPYVDRFRKQKEGARILLKEVPNPQGFGVVTFKKGKPVVITEKPKKPQSRFAVTGIYMYDYRAFEYIRRVKLSKRGEYEITAVNNMYLQEGFLEADVLKCSWTDCGTFESLLRANILIAKAQGIKRKQVTR